MTYEPPWRTDYDQLKSEFNSYPDVSNALHSEGCWFLVRAEKIQSATLDHVVKNRNSVIVHVCSKSWKMKSFPDTRGVEKLLVRPHVIYRGIWEERHAPCTYCNSPVPKNLIGLYTLHNWDNLGK